MSTIKLIAAAVFFSTALWAQSTPPQAFTVTGEIHSDDAARLSGLEVELYSSQDHTVIGRAFAGSDGHFRFDHVTSGTYTVRIKSNFSDEPILEELHQIDMTGSPLNLRLPERTRSRPVSGSVSMRELAHPVAKQAFRATVEAQRYSEAHDTPRAIEKLEQAIRIDPGYAAAHTNLGAQYAHAGRLAEAMAQFREAFEIGPPNSIIYSNMAWAQCAMQQFTTSDFLLGYALSRQPGKETEALEHLRIAAPEQPRALEVIAQIQRRHGL